MPAGMARGAGTGLVDPGITATGAGIAGWAAAGVAAWPGGPATTRVVTRTLRTASSSIASLANEPVRRQLGEDTVTPWQRKVVDQKMIAELNGTFFVYKSDLTDKLETLDRSYCA